MYGIISLTSRTGQRLTTALQDIALVEPVHLTSGPCTRLVLYDSNTKESHYTDEPYPDVLQRMEDSFITPFTSPSPLSATMKGFITVTNHFDKSPLTIALHVIGTVEPYFPSNNQDFTKITLSFGSSGRDVHHVEENYQQVVALMAAAQATPKQA